jgi:hypothetical protein
LKSSPQFTLENHLRCTFGTPDGSYSPYVASVVELGKPVLPIRSPIEEAIRAAQKIAANFPAPLNLCLSGGVDSEAMALAFLKATVPFKVSIWRYNRGLNEHDIRHARAFCEAHKLSYEVLEFDAINFLESNEYLDFMHRYRIRSPQFAIQMKCLEQIDGTSVMPWQPIMVINSHENLPLQERFILSIPDDRHFCFYRFFMEKKISAVPFFFLYSPELAYSFLRLPAFGESLLPNCKINNYQLKCRTYQEGGFEILAKPDKYTGFENLRLYYQERFGDHSKNYLNEFFRAPFESQYPINLYNYHKLDLSIISSLNE